MTPAGGSATTVSVASGSDTPQGIVNAINGISGVSAVLLADGLTIGYRYGTPLPLVGIFRCLRQWRTTSLLMPMVILFLALILTQT